MGLIRQFTDTVRARVGRVLDRLEDPAETLALARRRQEEMLADVRRRLESLAVTRTSLESEVLRGQALARQLAEEAQAALAAGRNGAAGETLDRRGFVLERLVVLGEQHRALADEETRLVETENRLQDRITEFTSLSETIKAAHATDDVRAMVERAIAEAERMEHEQARFEAGL